jgi:hypothetical protein
MKYAARAASLAGTEEERLENLLLAELEKARSNIEACGTGADLYRKAKMYASSTAPFLAGQFVLSSHLDCPGASPEKFGYEFEVIEEDWIEFEDESIRTGLFSMSSPFTLRRFLFAWALLIGAPSRVFCMLKESADRGEYSGLRSSLGSMPEGSDRAEILRNITDHIGGYVLSLRDLFPEDREEILSRLASRQVDALEKRLERLYEADRDLLRLFNETNIKPPPVISIPAETVLSRRLANELSRWEKTLDYSGLAGVGDVLAEARFYGVRLDKTEVSHMFSELFIEALEKLGDELDEDLAASLAGFVSFSDEADVELSPHEVQNVLFDIIRGPLAGSLSRIEKFEAGSEKDIEAARIALGLAKRFNFNVEALEGKLPPKI